MNSVKDPVKLEEFDDMEEFSQAETKSSGPPYILILLLMAVSFLAGYLFFKANSLQEKIDSLQAGGGNAQPQAAAPQQPAQEVSLDTVKSMFSKDYISFGDADRDILFVEISDPSCPYCHIAAGQNPELSKQASPQFQYVSDGGTYRPPLTEMRKLVDEGKASYVTIFGNGHGNGFLTMEALYCANEQGKFWEAHDKAMSNEGYTVINEQVQNDRAKIPDLVAFLADSVKDKDGLTKCLEDGKYTETIKRDEGMGASLAFQGTPHFIVNTKIFGGAQNYDAIEPAVEELL